MTGIVRRGRWSQVRGDARPIVLAAVLGILMSPGLGMPAQAQEEGENFRLVAPDTAGRFELPAEGGPDRVEFVGWVCSPDLAAAVADGLLTRQLGRLWDPRFMACRIGRGCFNLPQDADYRLARNIVGTEATCNGSFPGPLSGMGFDCTTRFPGQLGPELPSPGESHHLFMESCYRVADLEELAEHLRAAAWSFIDEKTRRIAGQ